MMRFLLIVIALAFLLALTGCKAAPEKTPEQPDQTTEPEADMRREIFFKVEKDRPLLIKIEEKMPAIRISSLLEIDENAPSTEFIYGLNVRLKLDKVAFWEQTFFEKTRSTKLEGADGQTIVDAVDPSGVHRLADRRLTDAIFGDNVANANLIEISLAEPSDRAVFLRVYRAEHRDSEQIRRDWARMSDASKQRLLAVSAIPPSMMKKEDIFQLLKTVYKSLPPEGVSGQDYQPHDILLRNEPVTYRDYLFGSQREDFMLGPRRQMAVNICGKGKIRAELMVDASQEDKPLPLSVYRVHENNGGSRSTSHFREERGHLLAMLNNPEACNSLIVEPNRPEPVPLRLKFLEDEAQDKPDNWRPLVPEYRTTRSYLTQPLEPADGPVPPVIGQIPAGQKYMGLRSLTVMDRADQELIDYSYTVSFHDRQGTELSIREVQITAPSAALELFPKGGPFADQFPSEPVVHYFAIPEGSATVEVQSNQKVLAGFFAAYIGRDQIEMKIPEDHTAEIINHCDPKYEPSWFYFRPSNFQELDFAGRGVSVLFQQVCYEVKGGGAAPDSTAKELFPIDYTAKVRMMERADFAEPEPGEVEKDNYFPVDPTKGASLNVPERPYGGDRPGLDIYYRCDESATLPVLLIDENAVTELEFSKSLIRYNQPDVPPGSHQVRLDNCTGGNLFVGSKEPIGSPENTHRRHNYFRIEGAKNISVPVHHKGGNLIINVQLYQEIGAGKRNQLAAWVEPQDNLAQWGVELPPYLLRKYSIAIDGEDKGQCVHFEKCNFGGRQSIFVPINSWFPPGDYTVKLRLQQGATGLVRFFMYETQPEPGRITAFYRD